jgi:hypothetical protein
MRKRDQEQSAALNLQTEAKIPKLSPSRLMLQPQGESERGFCTLLTDRPDLCSSEDAYLNKPLPSGVQPPPATGAHTKIQVQLRSHRSKNGAEKGSKVVGRGASSLSLFLCHLFSIISMVTVQLGTSHIRHHGCNCNAVPGLSGLN